MDDFLTCGQAGKILHLARQSVLAAVRRNEFPGAKWRTTGNRRVALIPRRDVLAKLQPVSGRAETPPEVWERLRAAGLAD